MNFTKLTLTIHSYNSIIGYLVLLVILHCHHSQNLSVDWDLNPETLKGSPYLDTLSFLCI